MTCNSGTAGTAVPVSQPTNQADLQTAAASQQPAVPPQRERSRLQVRGELTRARAEIIRWPSGQARIEKVLPLNSEGAALAKAEFSARIAVRGLQLCAS